MMPTLVAKPPQGDDWMHEAKFDGYRTQIIIDAGSARIFTRRGLDWTSKYRDLTAAARTLDVENAIIDGEVVVLNEAGLSDFAALRKAITRRQHDLYFVAFDLLHLNGHDLRDMALEDRREILAGLIIDLGSDGTLMAVINNSAPHYSTQVTAAGGSSSLDFDQYYYTFDIVVTVTSVSDTLNLVKLKVEEERMVT
jgi:ATP-dependent DNA ligase